MNATASPPSARPERPVVFRYLDARKFLADAFEYAKDLSSAFSHRYVAKVMGASSSGFFKDILNGRVRISNARAARFAKLFKLPPSEAAHFELLVLYTQAESSDEKERLLSRLSAAAGGRNHVLEAFQLEYFQKWHYAAVRELLAFENVKADGLGEGELARIAARFDPPLKNTDIADALRLLLKLKMIQKNAQGFLERSEPVVRSGPLRDPARIKPAIRGNIELALRALENQPVTVRPFSYLTISVSEATLAPIRERILALRREILDLAARDEQVDRLYQVNIQMFPLTRQDTALEPIKTRLSKTTRKTGKSAHNPKSVKTASSGSTSASRGKS